MGIAQRHVDWLVHKDTIVPPRNLVSSIPESSTARNRKNAINSRCQKKSQAARRALGQQVIGNTLLEIYHFLYFYSNYI